MPGARRRDATGSSGRPWMAVPERSGRHDVAAEGTAKRREDGPAAAEVLRPAPIRACEKGRHSSKITALPKQDLN